MIKPTTLIVLDGFGIAPQHKGNAVARAKKPFFDSLIKDYPHALLQASGEEVGLPKFEFGNSEVGHMNLGSGRVMYQELPKIDKTIQDESFFSNKTLLGAIKHVKDNNSSLHLMGLVSSGGVHSHIRHLYALLELAKKEKVKQVYIHAFTDGRDTPKDSARDFILELEQKTKKLRIGKIATICGRFWAMDRNSNWDRIEKAYNTVVKGEGEEYKKVKDVVEKSYNKGIYDEELEPVIIKGVDGKISENDAVVFFNFRSDRAKQITRAITSPEFDGFERDLVPNLHFACMTKYDEGLPVKIIFGKERINNILGEVISKNNLKQVRIAETEKYAHVTVFFNCGNIDPFRGEERLLVQSPQVDSYDKKPEMSAAEVTDRAIEKIEEGKNDFTLINYANADMVGHTGNVEATISGIETVDKCLSRVVPAILAKDGNVVITADHGNADIMINLINGEVNKEHTVNPVPFLVISNNRKGHSKAEDLSLLSPIGLLTDVTTTVLSLMGLKKSEEMTGTDLLEYI
ncbi:MAG: 2,3-bisphosphoglycerate-independent phosphoglycerate mutase [Parcubacteria group bacterium]|nr:2,3-bisphosphoglycerate-independent phosphoglycerate mutase [Parcubacteria group bacterium]